MNNIIVFRLKRHWKIDNETIDLYEEIKAGRKTSEWRDASDYWIKRLTTLTPLDKALNMPLDLATYEGTGIMLKDKLKVHRAWFTVGYPRYSVPRLEADITDLILHPREGQFEIQIANVVEITVKTLRGEKA